jgi:pimeloyl-ACP methyl ester carboxylesterase
MAALSMQREQDPARFIQTFSGSNRYILDFLTDKILERQSTEVQNFLLHTSVLEQLSAPLCDAVIDEPGHAQAQCGTLRVYENRQAHSGRMIDLNIVVIKASNNHPAPDPIFYLAGGPGGAATEDAQRQQLPYSLSQNHDLVFVDQRGTGGSNQVMIPTNPPDITGLTPEEMDTRLQAWVNKYLRKIDMDPRFYTTSVAMDDLDEVRQALGYDQINLVGYSYGATAAQYYLRQYESHVRTMTIGSGSLLDIPVFELWALHSQQALDKIFDRCLAQAACQAAYPNLLAEFTALMDRLAAQPVTETYTNPSDGNPGSVTFTADYFAAIVRHIMKDARYDSSLPLFIHQAYQENDWSSFTNFFVTVGGSEWWGDQMMERVIRCSEKWAAFDPARVVELSQGSFLAGWDISLAQNQVLPCKYTPAGYAPEGLTAQHGSQVPVLFLNGELDPIDPPDNMSGADILWPNSVALVGHDQSHAISDMGEISCWFSIMNDFIQSGSIIGLDTSCMQSTTSLGFALP